MAHQIAGETPKAIVQRELEALSRQGAGVAELLDQVQKHKRRFGRGRISKTEFDELSRYCWTLQQRKPTGLLWGKARELWGGAAVSRPQTPARVRGDRARMKSSRPG